MRTRPDTDTGRWYPPEGTGTPWVVGRGLGSGSGNGRDVKNTGGRARQGSVTTTDHIDDDVQRCEFLFLWKPHGTNLVATDTTVDDTDVDANTLSS